MRLGQRALLSLLSQGLNTAQNLMLALLAARYSSSAEYGAWGIAFAVFVVLQNLARSVISTPQLIAPGTIRGKSAGVGASFLISLPAAAAVGAVGLVLPTEMRVLFVAIAVSLPATLAHDALRYTAIHHAHESRLIGLDGWWLGAQSALVALLLWIGQTDAVTLTLAWGGGALFALIVYCLRHEVIPSAREGYSLLNEERRAGALMAIETLLGSIPVNAVPAVVGATLGLSTAGHFRGALTVIGGVALFIAGLKPIMTVETARRLRVENRSAGLVATWSAAIAALSLAYMSTFLLLPDHVGAAILGDSWSGTRSILVMFTIAVIVRGPFVAAPIVLRCRRQFDTAIRLRITTGWVQVVGPMVGALLGGLTGAAWGYAGAAIFNDLQALRTLSSSKSRRIRAESSRGSSD